MIKTVLFISIAKKIGVSAVMLISICKVETGLVVKNNNADPHGGSHGVCQVALPTAKGIANYIDLLALQQPTVNIEIAAKYLKYQQKRYSDNQDAIIASYNAGSAIYNESGYFVNQNYVDKVNAIMGQ